MSAKRAHAKDHARFRRVAEPFIRKGRVAESAMMGHPCPCHARDDGFVECVDG